MVTVFQKNIYLFSITFFLISCGDFEKKENLENNSQHNEVPASSTQNINQPSPLNGQGPKAIPLTTTFADFRVFQDNLDENKYYVLPLIFEPIMNTKNEVEFSYAAIGNNTSTVEDDFGLLSVQFSGVQNERYNALSHFLKMENPNAQISPVELKILKSNFWIYRENKYKNNANINELNDHLQSFQDVQFNVNLIKSAVKDTTQKIRKNLLQFGFLEVELNLIQENQNTIPVKEIIYFTLPYICELYPNLILDGDHLNGQKSLCF